jgi:hypothetical protein
MIEETSNEISHGAPHLVGQGLQQLPTDAFHETL